MRFPLPVLMSLAACAVAKAEEYPAHAAAKRLPLEVCTLDGVAEPLLCGQLLVYENRDTGEGRQIPVSVVVIPAQEARTTASAWIEHQGGPRYSMIASAGAYAEGGYLEFFRRTRDIVLVDPRGLHESYPLYCEALAKPRILEPYYPADRVSACREELEPVADLAHYSTINSIEDYEDIRKWLGYEQWDAGGWSFGGRFMLTYLHLYPDSIRTMALSFPLGLNFTRPLEYATFGQQAFEALVRDCAANADCAAHFPDPAGDLQKVFARLEAEPVVVEVRDPDTGQMITRTLTRDIFADELWAQMLWNYSSRQVPYMLHEAAGGNFEPFIGLAVPEDPQEAEPEGHYFSVVCPEEVMRLDRDTVGAETSGTFIGDYSVTEYIEACDAWGLPAHPGHPIEPGVFDVPGLVFTGGLDPVVQPAYGEMLVGHFREGHHIVLPQMAHGVSGEANNECYGDILDVFVETASVEAVDFSCVEDMTPMPFRVE